ncbi:MAG: QueT transporter family protein [Eubacteriales bacterium]|nr:QueT transporter family protein [Eubacteriales bacterium]
MKQQSAKYLTEGGIIAALYVILTMISGLFGLSMGPIQIRISEALCILPCFTPAAVPGLFVGCLLSNILSGAVIWDTVFGSLATLAGAAGTYLLRNQRFPASVPPIAVNTLVIPPVLSFAYGVKQGILFLFISIFIGELISAGVLGQLLYSVILRHRKTKQEKHR